MEFTGRNQISKGQNESGFVRSLVWHKVIRQHGHVNIGVQNFCKQS